MSRDKKPSSAFDSLVGAAGLATSLMIFVVQETHSSVIGYALVFLPTVLAVVVIVARLVSSGRLSALQGGRSARRQEAVEDSSQAHLPVAEGKETFDHLAEQMARHFVEASLTHGKDDDDASAVKRILAEIHKPLDASAPSWVHERAPLCRDRLFFLQEHAAIKKLAISADSRVLVASTQAGKLVVRDLASGKQTLTIDAHEGDVPALALDPTGLYCASGAVASNGGGGKALVKLWALRNWVLVKEFPAHDRGVTALSFRPDGKYLASAGLDGVVKVWSVPAGRMHTEYRDHAKAIRALAFAPQDMVLVSGSDDRRVIVRRGDAEARPEFLDGHSNHVRALSFARQSSLLASAGFDQVIFIWNTRSWTRVRELRLPFPVLDVALNTDGRYLVSANGDGHGKGAFAVWDVWDGRILGALDGFMNAGATVVLAPDGKSVAAADFSGYLGAWRWTV